MTSKKKRLLMLLPLCVELIALAADPPQTPQQLVEISRKAADLSAVGPYQLQATVVLNPRTSKEVIGQIAVLRNNGLYHSDLKLPGYREIRSVKGNTLYISRSQPIPLPKTILLQHLDRLWRGTSVSSGAKTSKISSNKDHGKPVDCFEIKKNDFAPEKFCFDPATSALVRAKTPELQEVEFQDFATFEEKYYPRRIIFHEKDTVPMEIRDILIARANFTADSIALPAGATGSPTCDDPTPVHKIKDATPEIPHAELIRMRSATVYLYGVVATDGSVRNVNVEYSPGTAFTESARNAFQQWRYTPAMCGDKPIPTEIETYVLYFVP
jgi:hypothetical protein